MLIMLADDQEQNLQLMEMLCLADGHESVSVQCQDQILRTAVQQQPDIIVLDIFMPGETNGLDVLRELRRNSDTAHIPVMTVSSGFGVELHTESIEAGANMFLPRPFSASAWSKAIASLEENFRAMSV